MGMTLRVCSETRAMVRADLADRIDQLGRDLSHLTPTRVAFAVDDIRRDARGAGMEVLATLASRLERRMATSDGTGSALPYLEAMSDAVALGDTPIAPAQAAALLASVSVRLHG